MDDGSFQSGLILQTNAYTNLEVENLIKVLLSNFNLNSYLRTEKNKPVIYIPANQMKLVQLLVLDYMHPSTHYKLGIKK
jgi:hypothetical protein